MTIVTNALPYNFTPTPPSMKDLLNAFGQDLLINFNCHHIGTIQSFNALLQTATATINYQKTFFTLNKLTQQYEPTMKPYPTILDCPIVVLSGGSTALTFPIAKGDQCLILFNDRDMDNWFSGSSTSGVATARLHSFSDAIILVGLNSLNTLWTLYDMTRAVLRAGKVPGTMTAVGVNPSNSKVLVSNTYPTNTITLNTLLQQLLTSLQSLTNQLSLLTVTGVTSGAGVSGVPSNAPAITAIGTQIGTIATAIGNLLE